MEASDAFRDVFSGHSRSVHVRSSYDTSAWSTHDMIESAEVETSGRSVRIRSAYEYKSAIHHARRASIGTCVPDCGTTCSGGYLSDLYLNFELYCF